MQISQTLFLGNKLLYSSEVNISINKTESEFYAATYFITLLDPTKLSSAMAGTLKLSNPSKLKYLELSDCLASEIVLQELLRSCFSLQKLSLKGMNHEKGKINSRVMELICKQNGQTLQVLDLSDFNFHLNDTNLLKLSFMFGSCHFYRSLNDEIT